ncbi:MAG: sugar phosphate isomerase/epimerase [Lentisphaerae bacterium]|nr:sugar phosphate isomerase/epimerase [Lentisphaerota bacterium]
MSTVRTDSTRPAPAVTYGVSASLFGEIPIAELAEKLSRHGWRQLELGFPKKPEADWCRDIAGTRRRLSDAGIAVPSVHISSAGWNLADPDDAVRQAALDRALACLEPAAALGACLVITHHNAARAPFREDERAATIGRSRQALATLADRARALGLGLAVENLPQRRTPRPGGPIADILEIIRGLGSHVGVCVDAGHSNANGCNAADEARAAGTTLLAVHIQDSDGLGEDQHLLPGAGSTAWLPFIAALDAVAPGCIRTFEVGANGADPEAVLRDVTRLRDAWSAS